MTMTMVTARQGPRTPGVGWVCQLLTCTAVWRHRQAPAFLRVPTAPLARLLCLHLQQTVIARAARGLWGGEGHWALLAASWELSGASPGVPPFPSPQGIRIPAARSGCWGRGGFPGYPGVPAHIPHVLSQHRPSTATTGDTSVPAAEGRDYNRAGKLAPSKEPGFWHGRSSASRTYGRLRR